MSDESVAQQVIAKVGLWWPSADEDKLRDAAGAWRAFADEVDAVGVDGSAAARGVIAANTGPATDAFATFWAKYDGSCNAYLPGISQGARAMAQACDDFADAVASAKSQVIELAVEVGATLVVGTALAIFTFGAAEAAAAGISAALISSAAAIGVELSATAAAIGGSVLAGVAFGAVEAAAVDVAVAQPIRVLAFHDGDFSLGEVEAALAAGGVLGGLFGGVGGALRVRPPTWSPEEGMPVLGRLPDTAVAKEWPGYAVLDDPYWSLDRNMKWVQSVIDQKGEVYLGSPITRANLESAQYGKTVFAHELEAFRAAGYTIRGDYLVPPG